MRLLKVLVMLAAVPGLSAVATSASGDAVLQVGSKRFTESYVIGEILTLTARRAGESRVEHRPGLGNTAVVFAALRNGAIDVYPDYTGTIALELLGLPTVPSLDTLNQRLRAYGLAAGVPLGFSNAYALAMPEARAAALGITRISQLRQHPQLRFALSQEFLRRADGWPGLAGRYGMAVNSAAVAGLDHGLAYEALRSGHADVIDVYATDPKIAAHGLRILEDDRRHFPAYDAVLLYRADLPQRFPAAWAALGALEQALPLARIRGLNASVELEGATYQAAAAAFVTGEAAPAPSANRLLHAVNAIFAPDFLRLTAQHLVLVLVSLAGSIVIGVPLGVWAHRAPRARYAILGAVGVLQTIPALALLALLIVALDRIGTQPALITLALYALLPIVRNTQTGLDGVSPGLRQAAAALGLRSAARFRHIDLPLAAPAILAGIRTAAVINVGTATIAAFVGAGGYGERIVAGLAVNDSTLLLAGAAPAATLAILLEAVFHLVERRWRVSAGMPAEGRG